VGISGGAVFTCNFEWSINPFTNKNPSIVAFLSSDNIKEASSKALLMECQQCCRQFLRACFVPASVVE
jgi:hypothetical protein